MSEERLELLRKIEAGELSPEEGLRLINALEDGEVRLTELPLEEAGFSEEAAERVQNHVDVIETASERSTPPDFKRWRRFSWLVFGLMVLLTGLSAVWMVLGWMSRPWGWGFWLAWLPFLIGVIGMWLSYNAPWLHVRIRQRKGAKPERIAISFPLPVHAVIWFLRTFGRWMPPKVQEQNLADMLSDLMKNLSANEPIHIQVNDEEDGEEVEVFIG
ncbi:MAG TPA: hypothetical protein DCE76_05530 [Anaerolineaceae bacterium]|jgi:hypothetical protein|nr:hypothetical protein [Anaerolineaceae bacterium]